MTGFLRGRLLGLGRGRHAADMAGKLAALDRVQAVIEFDLQGHVLAANRNFLDTMGYSTEQIIGQHHRMFVDEETRNSAEYANFWQRLAAGAHDSGRYRRTNSRGEDVWLQASYNPILGSHGKPFKVVKYATDITEQQHREADARGQLNAISKVQATIEFDLNGVILHANDLFLQTLGYSLSEIVGKHHSMFVQPSERSSAAYQQFWQKLGSGHHDAGQYLRLGKNGRQVWIEASYNPILDADGRPFKVVKFATNITRRVTAAHTLRVAVQGLTESANQARQANELAQDARRVAEAGGHTVQEVVATMESISDSSRKISDIIGMMDSIAFQTNLLALNAAVEAARAGEQGRGFAVVASEVRQLAQHSTEAAKEIKQLIQASVHQVTQGVAQVRDAGLTMEEIVNSSRQVTQIMGEVVQASLSQSSKLREVTDDLSAQDVHREPVSPSPGSSPRPSYLGGTPAHRPANRQHIALNTEAIGAF
ncbi:methyl-accepting chemotaxis protein [Comamonas sp. lk]|uniref:methyl-accepting chemotaxis protein n=1 Tax=Comamonas sp. lk TaxID=2201272 RepID=UPI000EB19E66|nr:methyl-accepting chemotaxis protein [Comamonas sp. lk]